MTEAAGFFDGAPMQLDRTAGWRYFRDPGAVYEADGLWYLTNYDDSVDRFAAQWRGTFESSD